MTIHPVEAELFHAHERTGGQTDMTKLAVAFRDFQKAPKKQIPSAAALNGANS
jgi:hypothetical protein